MTATLYELTTLDNGLRIVTVPMPHAYSVTTALYFGVGSRYESDADAGVSHLVEHMLFKGTTSRPTPRDIVLSVEGVGGVLNAATDRETTHYWAQAARPHLEQIVDTLYDMVRNSLFRPEDVAKEQQVIAEEINESLDIPGEVVVMAGYELLYVDHPLGRDIAGSRESVAGLTLDTVHTIAAHYYRPANAVFVAAGAVEHEGVVSLVERYAGDWLSDVASPASFVPARPLQAGPHIRVEQRDSEQAHLFLATRGLDRHDPDRYVLALLNAILGDGMASRLSLRIREELGLAYSIGSGVSFYHDTGDVYVEASVDPEQTGAALTAIREELDRLCTEPIAPAEVNTMREYLKGRLMLALESTYATASWYATQVLLAKEVISPEQAIRRLDAVTNRDVQRLARDLFRSDRFILSLLGPVDANVAWETYL